MNFYLIKLLRQNFDVMVTKIKIHRKTVLRFIKIIIRMSCMIANETGNHQSSNDKDVNLTRTHYVDSHPPSPYFSSMV